MIQKKTTGSPIDFEELTDRCRGKTDLANRLVTMFESEVENYFSELESLLNEGDGPSIAAAAHSIKGAASTSSARDVAYCASRIENVANQGDVQAARELLPDLSEQINRLIAWKTN